VRTQILQYKEMAGKRTRERSRARVTGTGINAAEAAALDADGE
jgi:hypothetical protein